MRKGFYALFATIAVMFAGLGFLEGRTIAQEEHQATLFYVYTTEARACMLSVDSEVLHQVVRLNPRTLSHIHMLIQHCQAVLDLAGNDSPTEKQAAEIAEIRLFLDGFSAKAEEILVREVKIEALYDSGELSGFGDAFAEIMELESQQKRALSELRSFRDRISAQLTAAW